MAEEDSDDERFIAMERDEGQSVTVSVAAFQLHHFGIMNSLVDGHAGFVSDDYLNAISGETTTTAVELETAGMWLRAPGGYVVIDIPGLRMAIDSWEHVGRMIEPNQEGSADGED